MNLVVIRKDWNVPDRWMSGHFSKTNIEKMLSAFNKGCSGWYYMLDFYNQKIYVTQIEKQILKLLAKGYTEKEICSLAEDVSARNIKNKKRQIFKKLDVNCTAEAIHKALLLKVI